MSDDSQLLHRYDREESEAAFAELVQRHVDLVYSVALRRVGGDHHRATEVSQVVFITLARNARQLTRHPVLGAWLHVCTRNAAANLLRAERRRDHRLQHADAMNEVHPPDQASHDWTQIRPVLDESLDQLNERERQAVILRFFENRSYAEIGTALSLQEDTARKQVNRALEKLQSLLAGRGVTSTVTALAAVIAQNAVAAAPAGVATSVTSGALAGAALTGSSGSWLTLLKLSPLKLGATALVVAGIAGLAVERNLMSAKTSKVAPPAQVAPASPAATPAAPPAAIAPSPAAVPPAETVDTALATAVAADQGKTAKRDVALARAAYERAAALGSAAAEFRLGYFYEVGDGVPQSYAEARVHYQRAIALGLLSAHLRLGILDLEGWGSTRDVDSAVRHISAAAESGDRAAQRVLSGMYFAGIGVAKDLHQALNWAQQGAQEDDPVAETTIGGVLALLNHENLNLSKEWFQLSAEQNYTEGMMAMASTFLRPGANLQQVEDGWKWLQLAAESGNGGAAFYLAGLILMTRNFAERPGATAEAKRWLEKSRDAGENPAAEVLELGTSMPLAKAFQQVISVPPELRYVKRVSQLATGKPDAKGLIAPVVSKMVQPVYPESFRLTRTAGEATVDFHLDTTGRVRDAKALSATHPAFGEAAVLAVLSWRFVPGMYNGHAVEVHMRVPVKFTPSAIALGAAALQCEIQSIQPVFGSGSGLTVALRLLAPGPINSRASRVVLTTVRDDTGIELKPIGTTELFTTAVGMTSQEEMMRASLRGMTFLIQQPAATAKTLRVLDGALELVLPDNDPDSTVTVPAILTKLAVPLESPTLAEAGITVVVYDYATASRYTNAKFGEGGPQDFDSGPMFGPRPPLPGTTMSPAEITRRTEIWGMKSNQVVIGIADPKGQLVGLEFRSKDGQPLWYNHNGFYHASGMAGFQGRRLDAYELPTPLPADMQLVCWVATKHSLVSVPFHFEDVPLPARPIPAATPSR